MEDSSQSTPESYKSADSIQKSIERLSVLEAGWNGPNSLPVNRNSLSQLLGILSLTMVAEPDLIPALVPLSSGGVQAEWHSGEKSVEVGVESNGQLFAFATKGERYHIDVELADNLSEETLQALRNLLHQLRSAPENTKYS